ncbi:hypothetical protein BS78_K297900 [Paspalum vaginatum]|uniref:RRM domain-containing protein n=1 Tax=Paspalum vaginatum TaxID=158149 RepID=A0A9W7X9H8_9POAL|nr:hypothetical protein BS78_K297900 [Paspalum vaginatum]
MAAVGGNAACPGDAVVNVQMNHERLFAFVEMRMVEEASNAVALDGILFEGVPLKIKRPVDYNPARAACMGPSQPNPKLNLAAAGLTPASNGLSHAPDSIFVGGLPYEFTEAQVRGLLEPIGPLQEFDLVKDRQTGLSKGFAFCVYQNPAVTDFACAALNSMRIGHRTLTVRRANQMSELETRQDSKPEVETTILLQLAQQKMQLQNTGGINRFKQHLAHEGTGVIRCPQVTEEIKQKCKEDLDRPKKKKRDKQRAEADLREDVVITGSREGSDAESKAASSLGGSPTQKLGPMDRWTRPIDPKATKEEAKRQQSLNEALWKERTHQVHQYIARWVYTHGIPFNAVDNDEFIEMVEAIGCFGPGLRPPSQYDLREKLLKEEHARMKTLLLDREEEKNKNGCSVMTDAWTDTKRSIMNVCTHTLEGASFMKSKEMSDVSHTSEVIFELVDKAIDELGEENVVQVVTDNASNNMAAKTLMLEKRPNIFWSSCATHTINLMLQGIGSLPRFKKTIDQAKAFTIFVYGHHRTLACMRLMEKRDALRKMVVDPKWDEISDVKTRKGKDATATMLSASFWKNVALCLKVFEPLVRLLRLVDGDVRPAMAFLYGELIKAKKEIKEAFGNVDKNYKDVMAIVDKKMKDRLDSSLHVAAYLLNPYYSYRDAAIFDDSSVVEKFMLCCETFFKGDEDKEYLAVNEDFDKYRTKQVYVQFNARLLSKKEKISNKKSYEVLLSNDVAEAQGFFYEGGDEQSLVVFRDPDDEAEVPRTGMTWRILGEAVGADEQLQPHRSERNQPRDLHEEEEFESEAEDSDYDEE